MKRLRITSIEAGKGAALAGIERGDILEKFAGMTISSDAELSACLKANPSGGAATVWRLGALRQVTVTQTPLGITTNQLDVDPNDMLAAAGEIAVEAQRKALGERAGAMIVTTTPTINGREIDRYLDVISAECVFGMNIFKDLFASFSDFFGGRSGVSQDALRKARETCIGELKIEAARMGADAIVGIDLDYSELSGQGKSMLFLVATGTAVTLKAV